MVPDDGVVGVPASEDDDASTTNPEEGVEEMADLPEAVAGVIVTETTLNGQNTNAMLRNGAALAANVLNAAMARSFDELGVAEGRSVSGVMGTPIASPVTQG